MIEGGIRSCRDEVSLFTRARFPVSVSLDFFLNDESSKCNFESHENAGLA